MFPPEQATSTNERESEILGLCGADLMFEQRAAFGQLPGRVWRLSGLTAKEFRSVL
jgi:hypothetical protein